MVTKVQNSFDEIPPWNVFLKFHCQLNNVLKMFSFLNTCHCHHIFLLRFVSVVIIGGSRGGRARRTPPPPPWDPILSFSHTFSLKSAHVGGPCPTQRVHAPLREILDLPLVIFIKILNVHYFKHSFFVTHGILKLDLLFGSFGLSTKEPYTIMLCPSLLASCVGVCIGIICAHLPLAHV